MPYGVKLNMSESKRMKDCEKNSRQLPAYLDYILHGIQFSGQENVENHLALCSACTQEYTDLLGMVLRNWMEPLLEQTMEGEPGSEDPDLLIEINRHWLEICNLFIEKTGAAEALSHLGILYELKGDNEQAVSYHMEALKRALNYVAIAASFVQLYKLGDTIRIIMFDEAFDKMDDNRISAMMDFLNSQKFQIILATPPAKLEVIGEKIDTILMAMREGTNSIIEEYDL